MVKPKCPHCTDGWVTVTRIRLCDHCDGRGRMRDGSHCLGRGCVNGRVEYTRNEICPYCKGR